jgi:hypothetical protein
MRREGLLLAAFGLILAAMPLAPTRAAPAAYDPLRTFAPLDLSPPASVYRSGSGAPGPAYWQNRADYRIEAKLDPATHTLGATEVVTYTNNSPDVLDALWLQLDQNIYRKDSRARAMGGGLDGPQSTEGYAIETVEVELAGKLVKAGFLVDDTRLKVTLPHALKAAGGQVELHIRYHYEVPGTFGGRTAWAETPNGAIYDIAQWYPRMQVYDDLRGWDTLPYLANEFYLEYGAFDYAITLPADMVVAGSGELINPRDVLTAQQIARLDQARASDATVMIRTPQEVAAAVAAGPAGATKTWRFHMDHTRDVAFTASRAFVWDAARINLPGGKAALAQSVYPVESAGPAGWGRSTEYLKDATEEFSARWFPYPWPNAINVAGPASGMEYPGILFDGIPDKGKTLFWITAHEIGHSWFPMVVGFDERRHAWMDEGFNTFIDVYESDHFQKGVYGPKRDSEYAPGAGTPGEQIAALLTDPQAPAIMTRGDAIHENYRHPITYFKTAYGLTLLREDILGPDRFDPAFRRFIADWAYKHPKPADFFRAMESAGGEDLSWFWRGWFMENWTHDLAVTGLAYVDADPAKGAEVTVTNLGQLVLPATLRVTSRTGAVRDIRVPVETWMQSGTHTFTVEGAGPIAEVTIDPDRRLPDADRANNSFRPK